ncbi:MAG: hypothetical protein Q8O40_14365 [Chloroflexota bacterium]|nr:hypothetical protein [Chloroflexota bacterium]
MRRRRNGLPALPQPILTRRPFYASAQPFINGVGEACDAHTNKQLIQQVYAAARDPRMQGRIAFIEDYDMEVARALIQGVDV